MKKLNVSITQLAAERDNLIKKSIQGEKKANNQQVQMELRLQQVRQRYTKTQKKADSLGKRVMRAPGVLDRAVSKAEQAKSIGKRMLFQREHVILCVFW